MDKEYEKLNAIMKRISESWEGLPEGLFYVLKKFNTSFTKGFILYVKYISCENIVDIATFAKKYKYATIILPSFDKKKEVKIKIKLTKEEDYG